MTTALAASAASTSPSAKRTWAVTLGGRSSVCWPPPVAPWAPESSSPAPPASRTTGASPAIAASGSTEAGSGSDSTSTSSNAAAALGSGSATTAATRRAAENTPSPASGASGDLTRRKILPALRAAGDSVRVLGAGRRPMARDEFRGVVAEASGDGSLAAGAEWVRLDYDRPETYEALRRAVNGDGRTVVY